MSCLNRTEECDGAYICPCLMYKEGLTDAEIEIRNEAIDEFAEYFHREYIFDMICRDDCPKIKLIELIDYIAKELKENYNNEINL